MSAYKCNLVLAGFGKSGTSSLHEYLGLHPQIVMSTVKEPHYFSVDKQWRLGPSYHNSLFALDGKQNVRYFGEASTTYSNSQTALSRIKNELSDPRIFLILRNPVERAISHYRWIYALGLENRPILEAFGDDGFGFDPNQSWEGNYKSYLQFSSYSKIVPEWQKVFGAENVLLLFTDELAQDPSVVVSKCFDFLGLESIGNFTPINANRTESASRIVVRPFAKAMYKVIPAYFRDVLKELPLMKRFWHAATQYEIRKDLPAITHEERIDVVGMLQYEIAYYNSLREIHSLLDRKP